ncbi:MAG: hypothetical protein Q7T33_14585 [Dehalococcoidia bacterium]|nr:hypothetical protein [Dehalococcoidia bacterium]
MYQGEGAGTLRARRGPPLVIGREEIDHFLAAYRKVLADLHHFPGPIWDLGTTLLQNSISV